MINVLAEGGYQAFTLKGGEWAWLIFSAATAIVALGVGLLLMRGVLAADKGTKSMIDIALAIQEGAYAYLKRQFKTIAVILVPLAIVVFLTSTTAYKTGTHEGLSYLGSGTARTIAFLMGCFLSGLTGFIGMSLAGPGQCAHRGRGEERFAPRRAQGRVPHRRRLRHVHRRPGPPRRHRHHHDLPEHRVRDPDRVRLRRLAPRALPARRRRHLHQGGRRRRRPRGQGRSRHPRGRPPQPGHHRRQRRRQRR